MNTKAQVAAVLPRQIQVKLDRRRRLLAVITEIAPISSATARRNFFSVVARISTGIPGPSSFQARKIIAPDRGRRPLLRLCLTALVFLGQPLLIEVLVAGYQSVALFQSDRATKE
jgi:hypothetical protein